MDQIGNFFFFNLIENITTLIHTLTSSANFTIQDKEAFIRQLKLTGLTHATHFHLLLLGLSIGLILSYLYTLCLKPHLADTVSPQPSIHLTVVHMVNNYIDAEQLK